jgi:uncharacterized membrane protein YgcG
VLVTDKTGGITLNQIFTERYRYKQMHGAGVPSLSDALRNYPNNYYVTYMREPISGLLSRFYFWRLSNEGTHKKYAKVLCHTLHEYMATQASHNFMFRRVIVGQPLGSACRSITTNYSSATSLLSSPSPAAPEAAAVVEKGHRRGLSRSHPSSSKKGRKSSSIKSSAGTSKGGREEEEEKKMRESAAVWRLGTGNETWREVCPGGRSEADFVDALEETLWRLRGRVFVGVTERFDESLWLFAEQAGRPFFRMSDYTYCPRNVVVGALKPKDLPPHTRQLMSDMNRLDSALVVAAGRVFDRRLACGGAADSYGGGGGGGGGADSGGGNSSVADSGDAGSDEQGPGEAPAASTPPTNSPREGSLESFVQGLRAYQERLHCTLSEIKANAKGGSMNHAANSNIEVGRVHQ